MILLAALLVLSVACPSADRPPAQDIRPSGGDDVPRLQSALDRGGTVRLGRGTYRLIRTFQSNGGPAHLRISKSDTTIIGQGATLLSTDDAAMFAVGPDAQYHDAPVIPLSEPIAKGATSIRVDGTWQSGDYIYIRMGQTLPGETDQPDAEVDRVESVSGDTIGLSWPTAKAYREVAGFPYGVAKVTDRTIHDVTIRNMRFDHRGFAHALIGGQVVGLRILGNRGTFRGGFQSMGAYRFAEVRDNVLDHVGTGSVTYTLTAATGTSDVQWVHNTITGQRVIQLHVHEGSADVLIEDNDIATGDSTTDENQISVRAYAYDVRIIDNHLSGSPGSCAIFVDESASPGEIRGNTVLSYGGAALCVVPPGWTVEDNLTPNTGNYLPNNP